MTKARDNADTASGGLVHIKTETFSAVAAQTLTAAFSATYDYYHVVFNFHGSTAAKARLRLSLDGTPASGSNYAYKNILSGTNSDTISQARSASATFFEIGDITGVSSGTVSGSMTINNPFLAQRTFFAGVARCATGGDVFYVSFAGDNTSSVSYNELQVFASTGNVTGTVSIFGYSV